MRDFSTAASEPRREPRDRVFALLVALLAALPAWACAGGGSSAPPTPAAPDTPESVWESLYQPRPEPLQGAVGVSVSEILLLGDPWALQAPVSTSIGIQELVGAELLRRRDVNYVERRRFAAAAERERRGEPRPRGAPPVGISPGVDFLLMGSWAPSGAESAALDFRLTDPQSGEVVATFRRSVPLDADPTSVSRAITAGLLETLEELGRLPAWSDPFPEAAPAGYADTGVPLTAVEAFFRGVSAEDRYDWEGARRAYQEAMALGGGGFFEPEVALARVARLRAGGSLGVGDDS